MQEKSNKNFIYSDMDKQRSTLLDAYVRKFIALGKIFLIETKIGGMDPTKVDMTALWSELDQIYTEIGKFIDYNDPKVKINSFL